MSDQFWEILASHKLRIDLDDKEPNGPDFHVRFADFRSDFKYRSYQSGHVAVERPRIIRRSVSGHKSR